METIHARIRPALRSIATHGQRDDDGDIIMIRVSACFAVGTIYDRENDAVMVDRRRRPTASNAAMDACGGLHACGGSRIGMHDVGKRSTPRNGIESFYGRIASSCWTHEG